MAGVNAKGLTTFYHRQFLCSDRGWKKSDSFALCFVFVLGVGFFFLLNMMIVRCLTSLQICGDILLLEVILGVISNFVHSIPFFLLLQSI